MKIKLRYKALLIIAMLCVVLYVTLIGARIIKYSHGSISGLGSVLGRAVASGDGTVVRLALLAGADPGREVPEHVFPPLVNAAMMGEVNFARMLLDAGADPEGSGSRYDRPLFLAIISGEEEATALLLERGATYDIVDAIFSGDEAHVRQWVEGGEDVAVIAYHEGNLLHATVEYRNVEAARLLLSLGMDPAVGGRDGMKRSPLQRARERQLAELVKLFKSHIAAQEAESAEAP